MARALPEVDVIWWEGWCPTHDDVTAEQLLERALDVLLDGRTAILIAHRLNTAMRADKIVVVDHGSIAVGTHDELLARSAAYRSLIGSGLAVFHPKGGVIRRVMEDYSRRRHEEAGYEFVNTPHITKEQLYITSGHLEWYAEGMFPPMHIDAEYGEDGALPLLDLLRDDVDVAFRLTSKPPADWVAQTVMPFAVRAYAAPRPGLPLTEQARAEIQAYRDAHAADLDRHVLAMESDGGVFQPRGLVFAQRVARRQPGIAHGLELWPRELDTLMRLGRQNVREIADQLASVARHCAKGGKCRSIISPIDVAGGRG